MTRNMNNTRLYDKMETNFYEFLSTTSLHGHAKVANATSLLRRFFWVVLIMASWAYCLKVLTTSITDYLNFPVISNYETKFQFNREFPAVTFCNHNKSSIVCKFTREKCPPESVRHLSNDLIFGNCTVFNSGKKFWIDQKISIIKKHIYIIIKKIFYRI